MGAEDADGTTATWGDLAPPNAKAEPDVAQRAAARATREDALVLGMLVWQRDEICVCKDAGERARAEHEPLHRRIDFAHGSPLSWRAGQRITSNAFGHDPVHGTGPCERGREQNRGMLSGLYLDLL